VANFGDFLPSFGEFPLYFRDFGRLDYPRIQEDGGWAGKTNEQNH
jgi:hypothetical protein